MEIREDCWLSAIFGHGVFEVHLGPAAVEGEDELCRHAARQPAAMYYAKLNTDRVEVVRRLTTAGMYVVDVNVTFARDTRAPGQGARGGGASGCWLGEASGEHHSGVLEIAATCFQYSRFHLDPLIPRTVADRIKHDWILSYIRKQRGDRLFVATLDETPVGFLAALSSESNGKRIRIIDLMGVEAAYQGRGIGRELVGFFVDRYRDEADSLQVGTQVANVPSLRLYEGCGFSVLSTRYVLHMHVGPGHRAA